MSGECQFAGVDFALDFFFLKLECMVVAYYKNVTLLFTIIAAASWSCLGRMALPLCEMN